MRKKIPNVAAPINRFPSCVFLKLNADFCKETSDRNANQLLSILTRAELNQRKCQGHINLQLSIRFGKEPVKVTGGSIWFGLKRGELRLKLSNAIIPIEKQGLTALFENEIALEVQHDTSSEIEGGSSISSIPNLTAKAKGTNKKSERLTYNTYLVSTGGTECDPVWIFEAKFHESILKGQISNVALGTAILSSISFSIIATFQIRGQQDILLTEAEGLWDRNIGRNKLAVLEREFFLRFIAPKLKPYLCYVEISNG
jgi:hypothetical protein